MKQNDIKENLAIELAYRDYILNIQPSFVVEDSYGTHVQEHMNLNSFFVINSAYVLGSWKVLVAEDNPRDTYMWEITFSNSKMDYNIARYGKLSEERLSSTIVDEIVNLTTE
jgi:hypothetical protein